ncbi:LPS export ABC transporter permease LptF [Roseiarcaceae bacterium H3SJ34-1]|uniref:LPS export ABC transporter permease LptF n=1 Tax=Terripilifer ovatus TaxID=3032367 RepID=UPI003AB9703A|nr:LPS export ABC transporter permease LptF [Roseiarcaceae bacterium H3SJ34-1]
MSIIERYILRNCALAFLVGLGLLTSVIWISQALREVDLVASKGQTLAIFFIITGLTIPSLVAIIAPLALFAAILYTLNKLNADSELIVMSAAGLSQWRLLRPFAVVSLVVLILVAWMSIWAMPSSFRGIRDMLSKVRADFVTFLVREGQFVPLTNGIVFHYRERGPNGSLLGIFIQDRSDPEVINTYIAESGSTVEVDGRNFLTLSKAFVQRQTRNDKDPAMVSFESYALDLAQFTAKEDGIILKPRERSTLDLIKLDPKAADIYTQTYFGRYRAELHDRFSGPLYVLSFAMIAFLALGQARTTRQGRGTAIAAAIIAVLAIRLAGFSASALFQRSAWAIVLVYGIPLGAFALATFLAFRRSGARVPAPRPVVRRHQVIQGTAQ